MIARITSSILGLGLFAALAGTAAAHDGDNCQRTERAPTTYQAPAPSPAYVTPVGYHDGYREQRAPAPPHASGYRSDGRAANELSELRHADLNRDGWVTLAEAMQYGRRDFRVNDRDQNRVLTAREVSWRELGQDDRNRDGRVSYGEYQQAIRRSFNRFDTNRDGVLARYELNQASAPGYGWRR
jgi:hypothetical protein